MSKKKQNRQARRSHSRHQDQQPVSFQLRNIVPLTTNQHRTFDFYENGKNLVLHGYAGTGKTFISLFLALNEILTPGSRYDKIIIVRSVVPSRDIGFLPGSIKDKIRVYEEPYSEIVDDLFGRSEYDAMKLRGIIQFTTTSFLRGLTFNNAIVIVDEIQNMTFAELDTVMTRLGDVSKAVFCGDFRQTDLNDRDRSGLIDFLKVLKKISSFSYVEFEKEDIVRSGLVRDYIIKRTEQMGM
jgi:phosphate starvation-inducible protein PhoH and related proteins